MARIAEELLKSIVAEIAEAHAEIRLVYLFGSQVDGEVGPLSDVDLAVLLARDADEVDLRTELGSELSARLDGRQVDLVVLNRALIELAYAVIAQGVILFERQRVDRIEYEANVLSRYGDWLPFLRAQRRAIVEGEGHDRRVQRYREALGRTERTLGALGKSSGPCPSALGELMAFRLDEVIV